uniref:Pkinase_Tyr domain-containing protein n=1 Tax=Mesocestoides corti TaxID=53468 RepID=A0A5K3F3E8_MESCO
MTLGADPFYGQVNLEVINLVLNGNVLSKPDNCPAPLYDHMLQCWSRFPEIRPTFVEVCNKMDEFVEASNDPESAFSGQYIYRVPIGGSTIPSQSTPTVGDSDWRQNGGTARTVNDSAVNLIHSNSLGYGSLSAKTASQEGAPRQPTSLQRHVSCPRPYFGGDSGSRPTAGFYYNRPSPLSPPPYLHQTSVPENSAAWGPSSHPQTLFRRQSDRYQYNRDPGEVDSMGYERPALLLGGPYFNTFRQPPGPSLHQPPTGFSPHYAIPARPPPPRDANYGIMHHSLYVGGGALSPTNNQPSQPNPLMFQSAHLELRNPHTEAEPSSGP